MSICIEYRRVMCNQQIFLSKIVNLGSFECNTSSLALLSSFPCISYWSVQYFTNFRYDLLSTCSNAFAACNENHLLLINR